MADERGPYGLTVHPANLSTDVPAATLRVDPTGDDVDVQVGDPILGSVLRALLALPHLTLPEVDQVVVDGEQAWLLDDGRVALDDPRWPSALAYALGAEWTVELLR